MRKDAFAVPTASWLSRSTPTKVLMTYTGTEALSRAMLRRPHCDRKGPRLVTGLGRRRHRRRYCRRCAFHPHDPVATDCELNLVSTACGVGFIPHRCLHLPAVSLPSQTHLVACDDSIGSGRPVGQPPKPNGLKLSTAVDLIAPSPAPADGTSRRQARKQKRRAAERRAQQQHRLEAAGSRSGATA